MSWLPLSSAKKVNLFSKWRLKTGLSRWEGPLLTCRPGSLLREEPRRKRNIGVWISLSPFRMAAVIIGKRRKERVLGRNTLAKSHGRWLLLGRLKCGVPGVFLSFSDPCYVHGSQSALNVGSPLPSPPPPPPPPPPSYAPSTRHRVTGSRSLLKFVVTASISFWNSG